MANFLELTRYRVWLEKCGLMETDFVVCRPLTKLLNNNKFGNHDAKMKAATRFAQDYQINK